MRKIGKILSVILCLICALQPICTSAYYSYSTYTYSIDGWYMNSPDAYVPADVIDSSDMKLEDPLVSANDITVDSDNNVYIVDAGGSKVVVLNNRLSVRFVIDEFVNSHGVDDALSNPNGVFVNDEKIYVADTGKSRIVIFDKEGKFLEIIEAPVAKEIDVDLPYTPIALAVDDAERMYIVSQAGYQGIIAIDKNGEFQGYIGAQKSALSAWEVFWRQFQTQEQKDQLEKVVSTEYNNITIDSMGLIYVTTSSIDEGAQQGAIDSKSTSGDYAPVKKLNTAGDEIMARSGFWPPSGEVTVGSLSADTTSVITGPSTIVDVALGPEGTWSIIDTKRSKVFTYDEYGRLLFIFGDNGDQIGNFPNDKLRAMCYMGDDMLLLDQSNNSITVMKRTEYGDTLINAIRNQRERRYDMAEADWNEILKRNNNFDAAYVGIGKAYYRQGEFEKAMEMYKAAYDTENYSTAFKYYRQEWVAKYAIVVPIVIVVVALLLFYFFRYAGKKNKETAIKTGKRTFGEEMLFAFHLMMHPFDGFWDLKHERRGSVRAATTYIVIAVISFAYNSIGSAYLYSSGEYLSIMTQIISVVIPVLLWCVANWCLTTLFDGEGSFKDIYIATGYALVPIPLLMIPATLLTNIFTLNEAGIITLLTSIMWIWVFMLVFFGSMITHDYTMGKNAIITVSSIVGMAFIMFIGLLFSSLLQKIVGFVSGIVAEISYRM